MLITSLPGVEWARLRMWASDRRNRDQVVDLLRVLDAVEDLRLSSPVLSAQLWDTACKMAKKLGYKRVA